MNHYAIIDNAAKFMPSTGGLLDIASSLTKKQLTITFTDNGPGIDPDKLEELFKPFSRVDGVMTFERQGQGLGLYIDRLCVQIMGGTIDLESKSGVGTTVTIILPTTKQNKRTTAVKKLRS